MLSLASLRLLSLAILSLSANAAPAPAPVPDPSPQILNIVNGPILKNLTSLSNALLNAVPVSTPKNIADVTQYLKGRIATQPKNVGYVAVALQYVANGLILNNLGINGLAGSTIQSPNQGINRYTNTNADPATKIYPKLARTDAAYTLSEAQLRAALYIPSTFDAKTVRTPVLLVPGTGAFGGVNFEGNIAEVLRQDPTIGSAVWLNIPYAMLGDAQNNAEYVAYAINYIASITKRSVSVVGWSQGNVAAQWSFKYWPSTRKSASQLISVSPDFHGTEVATVLSVGAAVDATPIPQSLLQQGYYSEFIAALRSNGGDSAYVPTTTLYSAVFDEIVQPQSGEGASAYLNDVRGVGVSNNEIQSICGATPAGALGTHESLLFNGLTVALTVDALRHGGPASPQRLDLTKVCQHEVYPGLSLVNVVESEALIPVAAANILDYVAKGAGVFEEPKLRAFATKG